MDLSKEDKKKAHITSVAIEIMHKYGTKKTTIGDISYALGMAPSSLYYYFRNKNDIVRAALNRLMNKTFGELDEGINSRSTVEEKLDAALKNVIIQFGNSEILTSINNNSKPEMLVMANEFADKFTQKYKAIIKSILSEGSRDGIFYVKDIELTASLLSSAVCGYIMNTVNVDPGELNEVWVNEVGKLLMYGLKKR
jgi:AcrR family transcriptional regulator